MKYDIKILVKMQVTIVTADSTWIKTHPTNTHKRLEVIRLGASVTGSIINSTHGKLSIWESIRYTHIRSYQKSARKLITIFLAETQQPNKVAFIIYNKIQ